MKRFLPVMLAAFFACGLMLPETPAQREARVKEERAWAKSVSARYDFVALSAFLRQTVKEKKSWHDVDLTKPRIGAEWKIGGRGMTSGDWSFGASDPTKDDFALSFIYDGGKSWLLLKCKREEKARFRVVEISSEEVVTLLF